MNGPRKIVVIGPESTGKSTLCADLADYYQTNWCPEFARNYLKTPGQYSYNDLLKIAKGQLELEDSLATKSSNNYYFIDTDMYVMKVWCEVAFQQCHTWILKQIAARPYHFYLLCNTDLPWIRDDLREYPDINMRNRLLKMYRDVVINSGVPWAEISGIDGQRLQMAVNALENIGK